MKNLMDMYLNFTEKRIKKYMRLIYSQFYNEEIVGEYLKTYVNARYYNIRNTEKPARAFYLRIIDELEFKKDILIKKNEVETEVVTESAQVADPMDDIF
jgi:predicted solute-binding protein